MSNKLQNILILVLLGLPPMVCHAQACTYSPIYIDWELLPNSPSLCQGHYRPFYPIELNFTQDWRTLPLEVTFGQGETTKEGRSQFYEATLVQGKRWLEATDVSVERAQGQWSTAHAKGDVQYHQPNLSVWAEEAFYDFDRQYTQINCADYRWYPKHARGKSKILELFADQKVVLKDTYFTTCAPTQLGWKLKAKEITLLPNLGRAKGKHLFLQWGNVPIFYWPYLDYPIDNKRHSGFLFPSYATSTQSGLELSVPYYFNLAPNYDLLLTLKGYEKRGLGAQSQFRYLTTHMQGEAYVDILPNDSAYQSFRQDTLSTIPTGYTAQDPRLLGIKDHDYRLGLHLTHAMNFLTYWNFSVNYHYVSDDNYFVDLGNDIKTTSTLQLPQIIQLQYQSPHWTHVFRLEEYQVLQPFKGAIVSELYRRQPQWQFNAEYPKLWDSVWMNLLGEAVHFSHPENPLTQITPVEGKRFYLQPQLSYPFKRSWGALTPAFYLDLLKYDLNLPTPFSALEAHPNRVTPIYTLDGQLHFERPMHFKNHPFKQTLVPRAYYVYIPYRNQSQLPNFDTGVIQYSYGQLFRYNRFSGIDRLNEANQISLSLNSQILDAHTRHEWLRMGVGEILYFTPQKVLLCDLTSPAVLCTGPEPVRHANNHSNLLSEVVFTAPQNWQLGTFVEWHVPSVSIEQASVFFQHAREDLYLFNINYYFAHQDLKTLMPLNQSDLSLLLPLKHNLNFLTRLHYDLENHQVIEVLGGIEMNHCCFAWQAILSRYRQLGNVILGRDYANQIMLQFIFKGLSSVGMNQPDAQLKQKIPGYIPLSERVHLPPLGAPKRYN